MDKAYVMEANQPLTLRLHSKGTPLTELVIFLAVFAYLYGFYVLVRHLFAEKPSSSKVKGM